MEYKLTHTDAFYAQSGSFVREHVTVQTIAGDRHLGFRDYSSYEQILDVEREAGRPYSPLAEAALTKIALRDVGLA